jgi:hypothetical protein
MTMAFMIVAMAAGNAIAGYHFTSENRVENEGQQPQTYTVEGWVEGDGARVVFKGGMAGAGIPAGSSIVSKDGGKTLYLVDPEAKTYSRFDLEALLGAAGSIMNAMGGVVRMKIEDKKVDARPPVDGGNLLGYPTRRYVFDTAYTLAMSVLGMKHRMRTVTHEEIWTTTSLKDPGFGAWLAKRAQKTGYPELDELIAMAMHDVEGVPLKQVTETMTTDKSGKTQRTVQTMQVTALEEAPVDASMFEVPAGYTEKPWAAPGAPRETGETREEEEKPHGLGGLLRAIGG